MDYLETYRSPNFDHTTTNKTMIVVHKTEGGFPSDIQWLCNPQPTNPTKRVSCTDYIRKDGRVFSVVDPHFVAWHAGLSAENRTHRPDLWAIHGYGNPNQYALGIEVEGYESELLPDVQYRALVQVVRDRCQQFGIPFDRLHIVGHYELNTQKVDPQHIDLDQLVRDAADIRRFPNGLVLRGGFREYYEANGDQANFGLPLTNETSLGGQTVQTFEYVRLEYHPELPGGSRVVRTKVGQILLRRQR